MEWCLGVGNDEGMHGAGDQSISVVIASLELGLVQTSSMFYDLLRYATVFKDIFPASA